jgi:hypothetical protein
MWWDFPTVFSLPVTPATYVFAGQGVMIGFASGYLAVGLPPTPTVTSHC